jgi:hypothetical protein
MDQRKVLLLKTLETIEANDQVCSLQVVQNDLRQKNGQNPYSGYVKWASDAPLRSGGLVMQMFFVRPNKGSFRLENVKHCPSSTQRSQDPIQTADPSICREAVSLTALTPA